jgi:hypothetical protein
VSFHFDEKVQGCPAEVEETEMLEYVGRDVMAKLYWELALQLLYVSLA